MAGSKISYSDLVPDDVQAELMQMSEEIETREWDIGARAVELCDEWEAHGVSKVKVCEAIAVFCKVKPGTIRDYEYCSRNVPQAVVLAFPELGRSHFRELIPYCKTAEDFRVAIDRWKQRAATLSVRSLQAHLSHRNGAPPRWEGRLGRARALCEGLAEDEDAPGRVRSAARAFLVQTGSGNAPG